MPAGRPSEYDAKAKAVYLLRDENGAIRYVGVSADPAARLKRHLIQARRGTYRVNKWIASMLRRDQRPSMEVVEWAADWTEAEPRWIARCQGEGCDLVNGNAGGLDMRQTTRGPRCPAYQTFQRRLASFQATAEPHDAQRIANLRRQMEAQHRQLGPPASEAIWRALLPDWMHAPTE